MPVRQTNVFKWCVGALTAMLAALSARPAAALLTTPTIELITDTNPILPVDAKTNHTLAAFSGYAADTITLSAAINDGLVGVQVLADALFIMGAATPEVGANITGYLLTDGVNAVYGGEILQNPAALGAAGDYLLLNFFAPIMFAQSAG